MIWSNKEKPIGERFSFKYFYYFYLIIKAKWHEGHLYRSKIHTIERHQRKNTQIEQNLKLETNPTEKTTKNIIYKRTLHNLSKKQWQTSLSYR